MIRTMESVGDLHWTGKGFLASTVRPCSISLLVRCPQGQRTDLKLLHTSGEQWDGSGDADAGHEHGHKHGHKHGHGHVCLLKHCLRPGHSYGQCQGSKLARTSTYHDTRPSSGLVCCSASEFVQWVCSLSAKWSQVSCGTAISGGLLEQQVLGSVGHEILRR
jgi:hypothetical protein